ncbi:MAG: dCTP deaminase [Succinatimonas sp.]|nr:dCTP deaminase [Succinatimonas sp.]
MSSLSDKDILELIRLGKLNISPLQVSNIQPGSIDLTLADSIEQFSFDKTIDLSELSKDDLKRSSKIISISDGYELKPGEFVTGHSSELISLPQDVNGLIMNRNSLAKVGLNAAISQYINPGFHGNKIIVIANMGATSIILKPGIRICTLVLFRMSSTSYRAYDQRHDTASIKDHMTGMSYTDSKHIDDSLSDFMNERIKELAKID